MATTSIRKPFVSITSPGGDVSAEGITFVASVNSAPTVEVILRRAKADVVRPLSKEVVDAMKTIQASRFKLKDGKPDTTIVADDGNGGKLTFSGFAISPVLEQSTVSSSESLNVVGMDAFLNSLGMSIYHSRSETIRAQELATLFKKTPSRATGDIIAMMSEVTNVLVGNLKATLAEVTSDAHENVIQQKHAANKVGLEAWAYLLSQSDVTFPDTWAALFKKYPELGKAVVERIKTMLQQKTSNFWDILNGLGAEFLFFYRPMMDGSTGSLVRVDKKLRDDGAKKLDAGVTRFSATDGNPSMLPLAGVILYGPTLQGIREQEKPAMVNVPVGQYPVEITPGFFQETQAPAWLMASKVGFTAFATKEILTPAEPGAAGKEKKNLDPAEYKKGQTDLRKAIAEVSSGLSAILQDLAEVMYKDMKYADSTATLEIPLDFTIEVGVRYNFSTGGEDGGQFSGFVRGLRHSLQLQGGATLTSGTTLSLTHINY